jgi:hypothetical protein
MFNFLKTGIEFNNLAKSMNGLNVMIQELVPQIEQSIDKSGLMDKKNGRILVTLLLS